MGKTSSKPVEHVENPEDTAQKARARDVDNELLKARIEELFRFKILLLGAGESGKSTVVKQLKVIHNTKLSAAELKTYGDSLHQNVIDCMRALVQACEAFGIQHDDEAIAIIKEINSFPDGARIPYELGLQIKTLFAKPSIQKAYERKSEFWLLDGVQYYIDNLGRLFDYFIILLFDYFIILLFYYFIILLFYYLIINFCVVQ